MRKKTDLFLIDGQPMLAPDENVEISVEDIDASDSGRDESGVMHRSFANDPGKMRRLVELCHENGIKVNVWTCDHTNRAAKLVEWGVDYITSNILE